MWPTREAIAAPWPVVPRVPPTRRGVGCSSSTRSRPGGAVSHGRRPARSCGRRSVFHALCSLLPHPPLSAQPGPHQRRQADYGRRHGEGRIRDQGRAAEVLIEPAGPGAACRGQALRRAVQTLAWHCEALASAPTRPPGPRDRTAPAARGDLDGGGCGPRFPKSPRSVRRTRRPAP